jgi:tRNA A-37 threonylcarbamoyl transferase component Bud32
MQGSLGEKIGEGVTADIHAWAPSQVVKLFKAGISLQVGRNEALMSRAVFAAGLPTPQVFDEVTFEGRFGIVLQRLDGPDLRQLVRTTAMTREQAGAILATLLMSVHKTPPPPRTPTLRDWFEIVAQASSGVPERITTGVLTLIERLPSEGNLCHGDLHLSNVIMTADGPKIIDWATTMRAPAIVDLARCHVIYSDLDFAPEDFNPERSRAFNAALQSEYAQLAGMSPAALVATMERCLPILRAFALLQQRLATPTQRERLIHRIEATLRVER